MANIHVTGWTKDRLDEIKEREEHSSYDSVVKSLLERAGECGS